MQSAIAFEDWCRWRSKLCQTNGGELTLQRLLDLAHSVDRCWRGAGGPG